jgi:serine/threonine-protein kinase
VHTTEQLNAALAGRYAIERRVGEGGMATVYLARDIKHNRRVALKVLKPDLGAVVGSERFLSEIEVTASLQHPNLLPLFDSGVADGLLFYVMPFVEGESLRARLEREKQLPTDEAIQIASAVASALDYAHRHGVIHRDLKPENILIHEGQPLVTDFGIALAVSKAGGNRITQTGLSLGTPQYMSPEQATGDRAIDGRTDVYSLGAVTYEMLAGEPPHTGSTSQAIIARVLTEKPRALRATRPNVMPHVEAAVDRALEKLPADRFATARELADALAGKIVVTTIASAAAETRRTSRERVLLIALSAVIVLWGTTGVIALRRLGRVPEAPVIRFAIATSPPTGALHLSVSPNGRWVVFNETLADGRSAPVLRPLDVTRTSVVKGTDGPSITFWSPDSRQLAFVSGGKLKRVAIPAGSQDVICDLRGVFGGGAWNADNVIIFSRDGAIYQVPDSGGAPAKVQLHASGVATWEYPVFLPDGDHFLVLARGGTVSLPGVYVASLSSGSATRLLAAETRAGFAPPNHLLFVRDEILYAQDLELGVPRLAGDPVKIADSVAMNVVNGAAGFAAAANVLVTREADSRASQLQWFGRDGKLLSTLGGSAIYLGIALSPDGKRIAATVGARSGDNGQDLRVIDVGSRISSLLVADSVSVGGVLRSPNSRVVWSPDSRAVTFHSGGRIRVKSVGGITDSLVYASPDTVPALAEDYTSDGDTLLIKRIDTLFALPLAGERKPVALSAIKGIHEARLSPDGKQIAYWRSESNAGQVYVASYPKLNNLRQISATGGGIQPRWRRDGKEVYFIEPGSGNVMMAAVKPGSPGEFTAPVPLFKGPLQNPQGFLVQWDVTRDGQRFLFAAPLNQVTARPLAVVLNWTSLLPKK